MNSTVLIQADEHAEPTLVVFGRDEAGKPRASWFDAMSADLATKAAELMNMQVLKVATDEQKAVARQLAPGRVFASGRAFTPFARATVFSKLDELARGTTGRMMDGSTGSSEAEIAVDNRETPASAEATGSSPAEARPTSSSARPQSREHIGIGSVVLATVGVEDGWWESIVIGVNGESFTLKWRDFPRDPVFVRRRAELALLPPAAN